MLEANSRTKLMYFWQNTSFFLGGCIASLMALALLLSVLKIRSQRHHTSTQNMYSVLSKQNFCLGFRDFINPNIASEIIHFHMIKVIYTFVIVSYEFRRNKIGNFCSCRRGPGTALWPWPLPSWRRPQQLSFSFWWSVYNLSRTRVESILNLSRTCSESVVTCPLTNASGKCPEPVLQLSRTPREPVWKRF